MVRNHRHIGGFFLLFSLSICLAAVACLSGCSSPSEDSKYSAAVRAGFDKSESPDYKRGFQAGYDYAFDQINEHPRRYIAPGSDAYDSIFRDALDRINDYPEDYIIPGTRAYDKIWESVFDYIAEEYDLK